jgi:hypothetical protein
MIFKASSTPGTKRYNPANTKRSMLLGQRVFAIALGYEDLNDHDQLRHDPMMEYRANNGTILPVFGVAQ